MNSWLKRNVSEWLGLYRDRGHYVTDLVRIEKLGIITGRHEDALFEARVRIAACEAEIQKLRQKRDPNTGRFIKG